jgi:uroporphyrinogen decarboxylase
MTELEVFQATVEHRRPDRILCYTDFVPDLLGRVVKHIGTENFVDHYGMFHRQWIEPIAPADLKPLDFTKYFEDANLPEGTEINENGHALVPSGFYHFWGLVSPLRNATSIKEIEEYPLRDYSGFDFSQMAGDVAAAHARGHVACAFVGHLYEFAWETRGHEEFLMDLIERPAWAHCMLERIADRNMVRALAFARAGVDLIFTGDDVANQNAMMFSPAIWREFIHSRWAKTWKAMKEINPRIKIWYHTDGNASAIIPEMVDAGLDILNPVQPECLDVAELQKRFGNRLSFDGCIGTQSTMPWGKPADVRARVKYLIETVGQNGGLIIAPTHILEPEVSLENIDALFDAIREYGQRG